MKMMAKNFFAILTCQIMIIWALYMTEGCPVQAICRCIYVYDKEVRRYHSTVDCSSRHIRDDTFSNLYKNSSKTYSVKDMDLSGNLLQNIPDKYFEGLETIRVLKIASNHLVTIPSAIFYFKELDSLDLSSNQLELEKWNFETDNEYTRHNLVVRNLNLSYNSITILSLRRLSNFSIGGTLNLRNNFIERFESPNECCGKLQELDLGWNHVKRVGRYFPKFLKLKILRLNHNGITSNMLSRRYFITCSNLEELYLDHNLLDFIPNYLFEGLQRLKILNLSSNMLTKLLGILEDTRVLQSMDVSFNSISTVSNNGDVSSSGAIFTLKYLNLSGNSLTKNSFSVNYFQSVPLLDVLDLSSYHSPQLPDFKGLRNLKTLYLTKSNVDTILPCDTENMPNLELIMWNQSPIVCDCDLLWLVPNGQDEGTFPYIKYHRDVNLNDTDANDWKCSKPLELRGRKLKELSLNDIQCATGKVPRECHDSSSDYTTSSFTQTSLLTNTKTTTEIKIGTVSSLSKAEIFENKTYHFTVAMSPPHYTLTSVLLQWDLDPQHRYKTAIFDSLVLKYHKLGHDDHKISKDLKTNTLHVDIKELSLDVPYNACLALHWHLKGDENVQHFASDCTIIRMPINGAVYIALLALVIILLFVALGVAIRYHRTKRLSQFQTNIRDQTQENPSQVQYNRQTGHVDIGYTQESGATGMISPVQLLPQTSIEPDFNRNPPPYAEEETKARI